VAAQPTSTARADAASTRSAIWSVRFASGKCPPRANGLAAESGAQYKLQSMHTGISPRAWRPGRRGRRNA
jgi:hypothetical protein